MNAFGVLLLCASVHGFWLFDDGEADVGRECGPDEKGEEPGIRYFYDGIRGINYPFYYKGCGNNNTHKSPIFISDQPHCKGGITKGDNCHGKSDCDDDSFCSYGGWGWGYCCSSSGTERYNKNREAANCPNGKQPLKHGDNVYFGRKCSHNFCGSHECVDEEFEAYCCV